MFMTGANNHVFTDSNVECHRRLHALGCTQHELKVFQGYGHQDPFMGKNVADDIFPTLIDFMQRKSAERTGATMTGAGAMAGAPTAAVASMNGS
jgi:cholesterol oxidase